VTVRHPRPARYQLTFHLAVETDPDALDPDALDAAQAILDDLAYGRVTGKALGARHISGRSPAWHASSSTPPTSAPNASGSSTARSTWPPSMCSPLAYETSTPSTAPQPTGSAAPALRTLALPKKPTWTTPATRSSKTWPGNASSPATDNRPARRPRTPSGAHVSTGAAPASNADPVAASRPLSSAVLNVYPGGGGEAL